MYVQGIGQEGERENLKETVLNVEPDVELNLEIMS